jgi:hypothetical protein
MPLNYKYLLVVLVTGLAVSLSIAAPLVASAAALNWTANQNITVGSNTLVISPTSVATTLTVNASNIVVVIPVSSQFIVSSSTATLNQTGLSAAGQVSSLCSSGISELHFTTGGAVETVTITPTGSPCLGNNGGGGGGGGGGGSPSPTPTPTPTPPSITISGHHPNGTLILDVDGKTVFLIKNNQRVGFRNEQEYLSYGYNFAQTVAALPADHQLLFASVQKAMEGTLVLDASDNKTVYMIGLGATKRGFTSPSVFKALGYSFNNLPKIDLTDYPAGPAIGDSTQAHPEGALVVDGQTIWWILGGQKLGFESMAVFGTYGFSLGKLVKANAADLALPTGPLVKFRDGTLVTSNGIDYIISDGKKLQFASGTDLVAKGYKTSNVISANLDAYQSGGNVQ